MTNTIGSALKTAIGSIIPLYLAEAETESYPFAVYAPTYTEYADKDGEVYKIVGDITLEVVASDYSTADAKMSSIRTALDGLSGSYKANGQRALTPDCIDGIWILTLQFKIVQFS